MLYSRWPILALFLFAFFSLALTAAPAAAQTSPALLMGSTAGELFENSVKSINVRLATQPTGEVVVSIQSNLSECQAIQQVTLNATNWQAGLEVMVVYPDDPYIVENGSCTVNAYVVSSTATEYPADMKSTSGSLWFTDNDLAMVLMVDQRFTFSPLQFHYYKVRLAGGPVPGVTVTITLHPNIHCRVVPSTLVFNSTNFSTLQSVRVRAKVNTLGKRCVIDHTIEATSGPYNYVTVPRAVGTIR